MPKKPSKAPGPPPRVRSPKPEAASPLPPAPVPPSPVPRIIPPQAAPPSTSGSTIPLPSGPPPARPLGSASPQSAGSTPPPPARPARAPIQSIPGFAMPARPSSPPMFPGVRPPPPKPSTPPLVATQPPPPPSAIPPPPPRKPSPSMTSSSQSQLTLPVPVPGPPPRRDSASPVTDLPPPPPRRPSSSVDSPHGAAPPKNVNIPGPPPRRNSTESTFSVPPPPPRHTQPATGSLPQPGDSMRARASSADMKALPRPGASTRRSSIMSLDAVSLSGSANQLPPPRVRTPTAAAVTSLQAADKATVAQPAVSAIPPPEIKPPSSPPPAGTVVSQPDDVAASAAPDALSGGKPVVASPSSSTSHQDVTGVEAGAFDDRTSVSRDTPTVTTAAAVSTDAVQSPPASEAMQDVPAVSVPAPAEQVVPSSSTASAEQVVPSSSTAPAERVVAATSKSAVDRIISDAKLDAVQADALVPVSAVEQSAPPVEVPAASVDAVAAKPSPTPPKRVVVQSAAPKPAAAARPPPKVSSAFMAKAAAFNGKPAASAQVKPGVTSSDSSVGTSGGIGQRLAWKKPAPKQVEPAAASSKDTAPQPVVQAVVVSSQTTTQESAVISTLSSSAADGIPVSMIAVDTTAVSAQPGEASLAVMTSSAADAVTVVSEAPAITSADIDTRSIVQRFDTVPAAVMETITVSAIDSRAVDSNAVPVSLAVTTTPSQLLAGTPPVVSSVLSHSASVTDAAIAGSVAFAVLDVIEPLVTTQSHPPALAVVASAADSVPASATITSLVESNMSRITYQASSGATLPQEPVRAVYGGSGSGQILTSHRAHMREDTPHVIQSSIVNIASTFLPSQLGFPPPPPPNSALIPPVIEQFPPGTFHQPEPWMLTPYRAHSAAGLNMHSPQHEMRSDGFITKHRSRSPPQSQSRHDHTRRPLPPPATPSGLTHSRKLGFGSGLRDVHQHETMIITIAGAASEHHAAASPIALHVAPAAQPEPLPAVSRAPIPTELTQSLSAATVPAGSATQIIQQQQPPIVIAEAVRPSSPFQSRPAETSQPAGVVPVAASPAVSTSVFRSKLSMSELRSVAGHKPASSSVRAAPKSSSVQLRNLIESLQQAKASAHELKDTAQASSRMESDLRQSMEVVMSLITGTADMSVAEYLLTSAQTPEKQDALLAAAKVCRSLLEDIRASGDLDRLVFAKSKRDRAAHSSHESAPASGSVHEPLPQSPTATLAAPAPWSTPSSYRPPVLMPAMFPIPPPPVFNYEAVTPIRSASPRSLRSQRPSRASVVSQSSNWTADADVEDAGDDDSDRRAHWWNSSDVRASLKHDTAAAARTRWLREQRSPQRAAPREMLAFANPRARAGFANNPYAVATRTSSSRRSQPRSPSPTHSKRSMRSSFTAV